MRSAGSSTIRQCERNGGYSPAGLQHQLQHWSSSGRVHFLCPCYTCTCKSYRWLRMILPPCPTQLTQQEALYPRARRATRPPYHNHRRRRVSSASVCSLCLSTHSACYAGSSMLAGQVRPGAVGSPANHCTSRSATPTLFGSSRTNKRVNLQHLSTQCV